MDNLSFYDIVRLINRSQVTTIDAEAIRKEEGRWALFRGENKAPGFRYPFDLLYLFADCSLEAIQRAGEYIRDGKSTQVVYTQTTAQKLRFSDVDRQARVRRLLKEPSGFMTVHEYLSRFLEAQLEPYRDRLKQLEPKDFVMPNTTTPIGATRRAPNPVMGFLTEGPASGGIAVLLAEPGQGKSYLTRWVAGTMKRLVPIFVHSDQWFRMTPDETASLFKTITHSFQYFETPIPWINGAEEEFVGVTLKAGLFCLIFDGFDEYILWNRGSVDAIDALKQLAALAEETEATILVTCRTSFWSDEVAAEGGEIAQYVYSLQPFDRNQAEAYFKRRVGGAKAKVERCMQLFDALSRGGRGDFVGRGFVLNLIADLVMRTESNPTVIESETVTGWLMFALCEREVLRQKLPISAEQQLEAFRLVAEQSSADGATTEDVQTAIECVATISAASMTSLVSTAEPRGSLLDHPLIRYDPRRQLWHFTQRQIRIHLLARTVLDLCTSDSAVDARPLTAFAQRALIDPNDRAEVAAVVVDLTQADLRKTRMVLRNLQLCDAEAATAASALAASVLVSTLNRIAPPGRPRADRSAALKELLGSNRAERLQFSGVLATFDFAEFVFERCWFDRVSWVNCVFGPSVTFRDCTFIGGRVERCVGFGQPDFENCVFDTDAQVLVHMEQVNSGKRLYTKADLKNDIAAVMRKFVPREGFGIKSIALSHLKRGVISASPNREEVFDALMKYVLEEHQISGASEGGVNVRDGAKHDVLQYASNGVFTGALATVFEYLAQKLRL